jgi:hypothetical protein
MATEEEIEERRGKRKADLEAQRVAQYAVDLDALDALEVEHGDHAVVRIDFGRYVPALPTMLLFRLPTQGEMKRYQSMAKDRGEKHGDKIAAAETLAAGCRLYPDAETYTRALKVFTGAHMNAAMALLQAAQGRAAEEGKT